MELLEISNNSPILILECHASCHLVVDIISLQLRNPCDNRKSPKKLYQRPRGSLITQIENIGKTHLICFLRHSSSMSRLLKHMLLNNVEKH
ncbi:CLUMA_CG002906, isoform A [Clunio marinus]|uniref:CLUMA_CG002906, isoform A n=1 Tax=Clunio marinus TaxID=568069 RepID=A0A1J1HSH2_9DIPT|nr:CLUMA_CG002906, isoform A [Clunio marinus]